MISVSAGYALTSLQTGCTIENYVCDGFLGVLSPDMKERGICVPCFSHGTSRRERANHFHLFRPLNDALHGRHFRSDEEVKETCMAGCHSHRRLLLLRNLCLSVRVKEVRKNMGVGRGDYMED